MLKECSQSKLGESWMVIWSAPLRPIELALALVDPLIVDRCVPDSHPAIVGEFPILIAVCTVPRWSMREGRSFEVPSYLSDLVKAHP